MLLGCLVLSVLGVVCYLVYRLCGSSLIAPKVDTIDITRFPKKYDPAAEVIEASLQRPYSVVSLKIIPRVVCAGFRFL